jgi:hypothetical protein
MPKPAAAAALPLAFQRPGSRFDGLPPRDTSCVLPKTLKGSCSATHPAVERPESDPHGAPLGPPPPIYERLAAYLCQRQMGGLGNPCTRNVFHCLDMDWPRLAWASAVAERRNTHEAPAKSTIFLSFSNPDCVLQPDSEQDSYGMVAWAGSSSASSTRSRNRIISLAPSAHSVPLRRGWGGEGRQAILLCLLLDP